MLFNQCVFRFLIVYDKFLNGFKNSMKASVAKVKRNMKVKENVSKRAIDELFENLVISDVKNVRLECLHPIKQRDSEQFWTIADDFRCQRANFFKK